MILIHPTVAASPATLKQLMQQTNCTAVVQDGNAVLVTVATVSKQPAQQGETA
ncbi:MAG: hypothetical protein MK185_04780 [Saccharospirillaceae bacterium]|nr:hypothetical protein [Saccharospirillaceae bacterium]